MKIKREIEKKLRSEIKDRSATILVGARQTGKTYLLRKIYGHVRSKGLKTSFFDLEQPDELLKFNASDSDVVERLRSAGRIVFIDEFHYLKNASKIFKSLYDSKRGPKIYASGSSSVEIHKHLKESLAGRKSVRKIYPCSYSEIKQVKKTDALGYYFRYGGLPGVAKAGTYEKRINLLRDILQSYLLKDIKSLIREENVRAFNNLIFLLAQYQGSTISVNNLANEIGLTAKTVESHLEILNHTYICFPVVSFGTNYGNELKKSKKYYFYDLGIRNAILRNFEKINKRKDKGAIIETFVFLELYRKLTPDCEIRFWRLKDGTEVDFVWIKNQKPYPIEVKANWKGTELPQGLKLFIKRYPDTRMAFVVAANINGMKMIGKTKVYFVNIENAAKIVEMIK